MEDKPRKATYVRAELSILDIPHKPPGSPERAMPRRHDPKRSSPHKKKPERCIICEQEMLKSFFSKNKNL